jgi:hypothetical protein
MRVCSKRGFCQCICRKCAGGTHGCYHWQGCHVGCLSAAQSAGVGVVIARGDVLADHTGLLLTARPIGAVQRATRRAGLSDTALA